jgi:hypothetical protein
MRKTETMKLGSADYSKVKTRIKEFRQDCPNGLIETTPTVTETHIIFKARILKDKENPNSAEATGHSMGEIGGERKKEKVFEKQESIAVGRALALLGYGADGEIASSEEMEEFLAHKQEQLTEKIMEVSEAIGNCESLEALKKYWSSLSGEMRNIKTLEEAKDAKKVELSKTTDIQ